MFSPCALFYIENRSVKHICSGRKNYERNKDKGTDYGIKKQDRKNGIVEQRLLLAYIIQAQQRC